MTALPEFSKFVDWLRANQAIEFEARSGCACPVWAFLKHEGWTQHHVTQTEVTWTESGDRTSLTAEYSVFISEFDKLDSGELQTFYTQGRRIIRPGSVAFAVAERIQQEFGGRS